MNRDGGCFSFKTHNKDVWTAWNNLTYAVTGESVTSDEGLLKAVNGITISPKKFLHYQAVAQELYVSEPAACDTA